MKYSAKGLIKNWPPRFEPKKTGYNANDYAFNEEKIANYVYGERLGNDSPGDGWKYRGRGIIQLTGKYLYNEFTKFYNAKYGKNENFVENPSIIDTDTEIEVISALWYFKMKILNDGGNFEDSLASAKRVSLAVNGGTIGLDNRLALFQKLRKIV